MIAIYTFPSGLKTSLANLVLCECNLEYITMKCVIRGSDQLLNSFYSPRPNILSEEILIQLGVDIYSSR